MRKHSKRVSLLSSLAITIGSLLFVCVGTIAPVIATYYNVVEDTFFLAQDSGHTYKCYGVTDEEGHAVANSVAIAWGEDPESAPTNINVPSTVSYNETTYTVVAVAKHGFRFCVSQEIHLPNTVKYIGEEAFAYCTELLTFSIPYEVDKIAPSTFLDCRSLVNIKYLNSTGGIAFGNNTITEIGDHAFDSCVSLEDFYTPKSCTKFGMSCFKNCKNLVNFYFPSTIKDGNTITNKLYVGSYAFADCSSLTFVYFETNMQEIHNYAFVECNASLRIKFTGNTNLDTFFKKDGVTQSRWRDKNITSSNENQWPLDKNQTTILFDDEYPCLRYTVESKVVKLESAQVSSTRDTQVEIISQSEITAEGDYAVIYKFDTPSQTINGCFDVETGALTIPETINGKKVKIIRQSAFANNQDIKSITFSNNLKQICNKAFYNCFNIESLDFHLCNNLKEVSYNVFHDTSTNDNSKNSKVTSLILPDCLEYIGGWSFAKFYYVNNFRLPANVKAIDDLAFYRLGYKVTNALVDLVLPKTLQDSEAVKANFKHIQKGSFKHEDEKWFFAVGKYAFNEAKCIRSVTMEDDPDHENDNTYATSFYSNCFNGASNLIRFKASKNLAYLGKDAFKSCTSLREVFLTYTKSEATGCDFPWCIDEAEESGLYGGTLFFGTSPDLVVYVDGPRAPGILDSYTLTAENTAKIQNNSFWNAETPDNNKVYNGYNNEVKAGVDNTATSTGKNALGRKTVPTYYNADLSSIKYWDPKTKTILTTAPVTLSDYNAGVVAFVKNTSNKYSVTRYYFDPASATGHDFVDLTAVPDISDSTTHDLVEIGDTAFAYALNISGENPNKTRQQGHYFVLPDTITRIGDRAFYRSTGDAEKGNGRYGVRIVTYKDTTTGNIMKEDGTGGSLADLQSAISALEGQLDEFKRGYCVLPGNVTYIGKLAFYNNIFKTVRITSSLSFFGLGAFVTMQGSDSKNRNTIENIYMTDNSNFELHTNGVYYVGGGANKKMLISQANGATGTLNIDAGTKAIGTDACVNTKYSTINLNSGLTTIYGYGLARNKSLTTVGGGADLRYIGSMENPTGKNTGWSDDGYTEVWDNTDASVYDLSDFRKYAYQPRTIIDSLGGAFYDCSNLKTLNFKAMSQLRKVGYFSFNNCKQLNDMVGGDSYVYKEFVTGKKDHLDEISPISDGRADNSKNVLDLSNDTNLHSIEAGAFLNCNAIKYVHLPNNRGDASESNIFIGQDPETGIASGGVFSSSSNMKILVGEPAAYSDNIYGFGSAKKAGNHYFANWAGSNTVVYYHVDSSFVFDTTNHPCGIPKTDSSTLKYWTKVGSVYLLFNTPALAREYFGISS